MAPRPRGKSRPAARRPTGAAASPDAWLAALPPAAAAELSRVRDVIRAHLPAGYREAVRGSVIAYEVPLERYPDTYNGQPLWYAALGAPKSYLTLHLMGAYGSPELRRRLADGFSAAGKKLDMGKACVRFRKADDLALGVIGEIVAALPLEKWVAIAKASRRT
ncbi:MAG TPA: DUF1801 domain-containing protein [Gemmatimonadales bacterium]|nr:DUF1801 domain-containing protein [Gemmatimonadales bacterium]